MASKHENAFMYLQLFVFLFHFFVKEQSELNFNVLTHFLVEEEFSDLSDIDIQPVKHSERSRRPISSGRKRDVNDITLSDLEIDDTFPPKTPEVVNLTQKVLNHYFPKKMSSTQRIFKWLADCQEKSSGSTLPAHLPNISVTCRSHLQSPQLETM